MDSDRGMGGMFGFGVYQPGSLRLSGRQFVDSYYREEMIWDLTLGPDGDSDGIPNVSDRCPLDSSFSQADADGDGIADGCDWDPYVRPDPWKDTDGDGFADVIERMQGTNPADPNDSMRSKTHKPGPITLHTDQPISQNWPTVILTHGLQAKDLAEKPEELWTSSNVDAVGAGHLIDVERALRVGNANLNIIQVIWDDAYQASTAPQRTSDLAAWEKYPNAAEAVALRVVRLLGNDYAEPIHFIGHSLGTAVNARAAALILTQLHNVKRAQVTALDRPHHINKIPGLVGKGLVLDNGQIGFDEFETIYGFGSTFFFSTLGRLRTINPNLDIKLDNYYSDPNSNVILAGGVGDVATPSYTLPTYNHPELIEPNDLQDLLYGGLIANNHTGVHQWYRWTITPNLMGSGNYAPPAAPSIHRTTSTPR